MSKLSFKDRDFMVLILV